MSVRRLDWDSAFFGSEIGSVEGGDPAAAAAAGDAAGLDCLYYLASADDPHSLWAAQQAGFRVVDIRVTLARDVDPAAAAPPPEVRTATTQDVPALERIARERFTATRFYADPNFSRRRSGALYAAWLTRGMQTAQRRTLVSGDAEGFIICELDRGAAIGTIELIGVAEKAAGRGVGTALMAGASAEFARAGLRRAQVVTQGRNLAAQRLYAAQGYRPVGVALWLHRWRDR